MNYFVPPQGVQVPNIQGVPGLVQMPQVLQAGQVQMGAAAAAAGGLTPQMIGAASHPQLHMIPQHLQPHMQPGLMSAPRVVPVAHQAQLQQLIAVSQYQQAQQYQQAIRQQSYQRSITTVASAPARPTVLTPKSPPVQAILKPDTVDAEVQTPECDPNPEADSSTKARIITPTLLCCSTIVSSEYRQLQSRILTWGEQNERQALEVTRVKADISPSTNSPMPSTTATVIIMDDRHIQFNVCGKVIQSCAIAEKEDSQLDEQSLREYLDMLGEGYSFCCGFSDKDLQDVGSFAVVKCNNLIQRQTPVPAAYSVSCSRWCKVSEDDGEESSVRCATCKAAFEKLKTDADVSGGQVPSALGKRPAPVCLDDLPTQPCTKRPRLLEVTTAKSQLDAICEQMASFKSDESNNESVKSFLDGLANDLQQIQNLYQEVEVEEEEVKEVESKEEEPATADDTNDEMIESELLSKSPVVESEDIDEDALLNGTESNPEGPKDGEENHISNESQILPKSKDDSTESTEKNPVDTEEVKSAVEVNGEGEK